MDEALAMLGNSSESAGTSIGSEEDAMPISGDDDALSAGSAGARPARGANKKSRAAADKQTARKMAGRWFIVSTRYHYFAPLRSPGAKWYSRNNPIGSRAWFSGKTTAFQAVVGSSILPARTSYATT